MTRRMGSVKELAVVAMADATERVTAVADKATRLMTKADVASANEVT